MDYLAPFLARLGDPPTLTKEQAQRVHDDCLQDLKSRLVDVANLIQKRYEQVIMHVHMKACMRVNDLCNSGNNRVAKEADRIPTTPIQCQQAG